MMKSRHIAQTERYKNVTFITVESDSRYSVKVGVSIGSLDIVVPIYNYDNYSVSDLLSQVCSEPDGEFFCDDGFALCTFCGRVEGVKDDTFTVLKFNSVVDSYASITFEETYKDGDVQIVKRIDLIMWVHDFVGLMNSILKWLDE